MARRRKNTARPFLESDLAQVEQLLSHIPDDRLLERAGLEYRRSQLQEEIAAASQPYFEPAALVDLIFSGNPVLGSTGIDAAFGARMIFAFEQAVAAAGASRRGTVLGARGPLPRMPGLHITNVVRGQSFGFRLEEIGQQELMESQLDNAVNQINEVLQSLKNPNEDAFADAASEVNGRVIVALKTFMQTLAQSKAVCKVVAPEQQVSFESVDIVEAAAEKISKYQIIESEQEFQGILTGLLPAGRRFEFLPQGQEDTVAGRIGREIGDPESLSRYFSRRCVATIKTTTISRPDRVSTRHTLLAIESPEFPALPIFAGAQ